MSDDEETKGGGFRKFLNFIGLGGSKKDEPLSDTEAEGCSGEPEGCEGCTGGPSEGCEGCGY